MTIPRSSRALSPLLLAWLCALGSGPSRHPEARPLVVRSTAALALREVADAPHLAPHAVAARVIPGRHVERDAPPPYGAASASRLPSVRAGVARDARTTIAHQSHVHAGRPRWRSYDAAAPPARSLSAR